MPLLTPQQYRTVSDQPGLWPVNPPQPQQGFGFITTLVGPLFTNFSFPVTNSFGTFLGYGTVTATSGSVNVQDYNNHALQFSIKGTGQATASIQSTVDSINLVPETSFALATPTSSIYRVTGRRFGFVASCLTTGNVTASLYVVCGE